MDIFKHRKIRFSKFYWILFIMFSLSCQTSRTIVTTASVTVLDYGADATGKKDSFLAFQKAMKDSKIKKIIIPAGTYRIDKTLKITKPIHLEAGAKIIRVKKARHTQGSVFWLYHNYASITGDGYTSIIQSESISPEGLIKIGHENMDKSHTNVSFCAVRNLQLIGKNDEKSLSTGIKIINPQIDGKVSYFHTVENVVIKDFNTGIWLQGWANGCSISKIFLYRVGNKNLGSGILLEGAMENRVYDVFHHFSKDANTLTLVDLKKNNKKYSPNFNFISGVISEQGGKDARCLNIKAGIRNSFNVLNNTNRYHFLFPKFKENKNYLSN